MLFILFILYTFIILFADIDADISYEKWKLLEIRPRENRFDSTQKIGEIFDKFDKIDEKNFTIIDLNKDGLKIGIEPQFAESKFLELEKEWNFSSRTLHNDISQLISEVRSKRKRAVNEDDKFTRYMNYEKMEEYFSVLEKLNPGIIRRKIVGKSFEGRNISLFIISSPKIGVKCNPDNKVKNNKLATKNESWISELNNFNNNWQLDGRDNLRYKREFEIRTNSRKNRAENRPNRNGRIPRKSERRILLNGTNTHNFIYIHSGLLKNVKTSNNKSRNGGKLSTSKPIIFIDGGLHSREWVCPAVALYFIQKLLSTPSLISNIDWYIMPLVNPDGYKYSWDGDRFWRKTRSKSTDSDCYGADMNRNFNHHWGEVDTSKNPCSEHYGGTGPNSEVETRVMRDVLIKQKHRLKAYVSLHSWGQQILYPYSYSELKLPSTMDEMDRMGKGMVNAIKSVDKTEYNTGRGSVLLYPASGTSADWVYDVLGVTYSYLIELRDKLGLLGFLLPDSFITPTGEDLFAAMKYLSSEILKKENVTCHQK